MRCPVCVEVRMAAEPDLNRVKSNRRRIRTVFDFCRARLERRLQMKTVFAATPTLPIGSFARMHGAPVRRLGNGTATARPEA